VRIFWSSKAWEDYLNWQQTDTRVLEKINSLIKDISRSPFRGIGKTGGAQRTTFRMVVAPHHRRASVGLSRNGKPACADFGNCAVPISLLTGSVARSALP
jgi:hypothetical protein